RGLDPGPTPTLERRVGIHVKRNEDTNILASMNSLAEAHIAKGRYDEASKVLERLIQREPQNAQHRNKLSFVKSQIGGVDTVPGRVKGPPAAPPAPPPAAPPPPPIPSMEIEVPVPKFELDDLPSPSLHLDVRPLLDLG